MMINKRLIGTVSESKKYIAGNVALQWCALAANIAMIGAICRLLERLYRGTAGTGDLTLTVAVAALAVLIRFGSHTGAARMGYLSSKAVKRKLREMIYGKLLRLGSAYKEQAQTSEVVQVAVEGVDQLETYFGAYLPQFFYAMLAPLTLFAALCFVNVPSAIVLLVCVPLIPVAIAAVQTWAKKLLSKYWDRHVPGKPARPDDPENLPGGCVQESGDERAIGTVPPHHHEGPDHAAQLFDKHSGDIPGFDCLDHFLKTRTLHGSAGNAVIHEKDRVRISLVLGGLLQYLFLGKDLSRVIYPMFFLSNTK